ncbi:MAG: hypothetical protein QI223_08130 [Candidatus Korarchaeota archaeon]|nr:hypothetical protein [Candidatus Korarchaeota archaeon]
MQRKEKRSSLVDVALALARLADSLPPGKPLTPSSIGRAGIDASWHTIMKAARLISDLQEALWERGLAIEVFRDGREWRIVFRRRFEGLPVRELAERVRELYFPRPDELDVLLAAMLSRGAVSPESAVRLTPGPALERALELGLAARAGEGYHLTELGVGAARNALRMYPELAECVGGPAGGVLPGAQARAEAEVA